MSMSAGTREPNPWTGMAVVLASPDSVVHHLLKPIARQRDALLQCIAERLNALVASLGSGGAPRSVRGLAATGSDG